MYTEVATGFHRGSDWGFEAFLLFSSCYQMSAGVKKGGTAGLM